MVSSEAHDQALVYPFRKTRYFSTGKPILPLPVEVIRQNLYGSAIFRPTRRDNCGKVLLVIKQMIGLSKHHAQHPDRPTGTLVLGFVYDGFSGGDETAFFHYTAAGRVVYKMPGDKGSDAHL